MIKRNGDGAGEGEEGVLDKGLGRKVKESEIGIDLEGREKEGGGVGCSQTLAALTLPKYFPS